jgi:hypothetical protein
MDLIKEFSKVKKPTYEKAERFVRRNVKKEERARMFKKIRNHFGLFPPKPVDSFTYVKEGRKTYRIRQVKNGVIRHYSVQGINALRSARKAHKEEVRFNDVTKEHTPVRKKYKKRKVNKVKQFYDSLKDCYYIIKDFSVYLFDDEDDRIFIMDESGKDIEEKEVVKFYMTPRKPVIDDDREDITYWHYKKLECGYYLLMVFPTLYFRDNRVVFNDRFYFGREITIGEAMRQWKTVKRVYGYEETVVLINDIKRSKGERASIVNRVIKKRKEEARKNKKQLASIMSLDAEVLKNRTRPLKLVMRNHSDRTVINYAENKVAGRIDRHLRSEAKEKQLDKFFKEYNER